MNIKNLESVYEDIKASIKLTGSFTGIKQLPFIIKACRLKPIQYFFFERNKRILLYNHWFDEYGNTLSITKDKKINIIYNNLSINRSKIICTDLYDGLTQDKIIKMSKMAYIFTGTDEELEECSVVVYLGLDNYLRCFMYSSGEWSRVSPLIIGISQLKAITNNKDILFYKPWGYKKYPLPCTSGSMWLTCLPASEEFVSIINKKSEIISDILKGHINGTTR